MYALSQLRSGLSTGLNRTENLKTGMVQLDGALAGCCIETIEYLKQVINIPSKFWIRALDKMIRGMKSDGDWYQLDRLWIFSTEYQDNARVSVVNPTPGSTWPTNITEVNSPGWTALVGYTGNGTSSYLNTNYVASVNTINFELNYCSLGGYMIKSTGATGGNVAITGSEGSSGQFSHLSFASTLTGLFTELNQNTSTSFNVSYSNLSTMNTGFYYANRNANVNNMVISYFKQNLLQMSTSSSYTGTGNTISLPNKPAFALAINDNGTPLYYNKGTLANVFYGSASINQSNFYQRIQAFMTTIESAV